MKATVKLNAKLKKEAILKELELFKREIYVIQCEEEHQTDKLSKMFKKTNMRWSHGPKVRSIKNWGDYKDKTVYVMQDARLWYGDVAWATMKEKQIISYDELIRRIWLRQCS